MTASLCVKVALPARRLGWSLRRARRACQADASESVLAAERAEGGDMTDARDDWKPVARRLWVWPVAILVSFPIGGLVADLVVDGVDSVGAALAGGLIAGAIIGAAEWFALRQWVPWLWIAA